MCLSIMDCFCMRFVFNLFQLLLEMSYNCLLVCLAFCPWLTGLSGDCSPVMGVAFSCFLFLGINNPVFALYTEYAWSLWLWSHLSMMVPWVQSPIFPHWFTTIDPTGIKIIISACIIVLISLCLSTNAP